MSAEQPNSNPSSGGDTPQLRTSLIDQLIDPMNQEKLINEDLLKDPEAFAQEFLNSQIDRELIDKDFQKQFCKEFDGQTTDIFQQIKKDIRTKLKNKLKNLNIYMNNIDTLTDQFVTILQKSNLITWPEKNIESQVVNALLRGIK